MNRRELLKTLGAGAGGALVGVSEPRPPLGAPRFDPVEKSATPKRFGLEHARRLKFVRDAGFVRDDRQGFYTVAQIDADLRERHSVWVFARDGSGARRLAGELRDLSAPAPSPDGRRFALLAEVAGNRQIFLVPVAGGPVRRLTTLPQGVSGRPVWSPDGRSIAFTALPAKRRDPSLPYRVDRVTYRFDGLGYLDDAVQDIYVVDVASGVVRQMTSDRAMNGDPRWSPDGRSLSYLVSFPPDRAWNFLPELHVLDLASRASRVVVGDWGGVFAHVWCADGQRIAFIGCPAVAGSHSFAEKHDLWTLSVAGGKPECRTASLLPGVGIRIQDDLPVSGELAAPRIVVEGDVAYLSGQAGGDVFVYRVALTGAEKVERVVEREGSSYFVDFDPKSGILYSATSFVEPPELMVGTTRITRLNDELLRDVARPGVRTLKVTAPDGLESEAWVLTPPGESGPWPSVLYVHGGPYGAFGSTYVIDFQLLASAGFAVVFHNFRGSAGYGAEFARKIIGPWGKAGSLDHHATVDEAIRAGIADSERLGVCGLSHGGFATCWLLGNSERFKAGVAENPVTNWNTMFGISDSEWWIPIELGGTPLDVPDAYRERSPLTYARNCKVPLLFIVGEADMRCTPAESEQYYRVLKAKGVPTEMLRLPNSSHTGSATGPVPARIAQNEALVDWFKRYLAPRT